MKAPNIQFLQLITLLFLLLVNCSENKFVEKLELGNDLYSKTFHYQTTKPGPIQVEYVDKNSGDILNDKSTPFFEFVLNSTLTNSLDKLWVFDVHDTREMENGGLEHQLVFKGVKGHAEGLIVKIVQQVFPGSTLIREKLELNTLEQHSFTLNKLDNKLHFQFPRYGIKALDNNPKSTEIRIASWELKPITFKSNNPKRNQNHMYYPNIITNDIEDELKVKGPINILSTNKLNWISAYEHASQDNLAGLLDESKISEDGKIVDAMQGTKGMFNFPIQDEDFRFLEIGQKNDKGLVAISNSMVRGGYLDGEVIDKDHPYSTVWNATAFHEGNDIENSKIILRNYLFNQICEKAASRRPEFYYNTWGMQRADRTKPLRGILTYERIFEEIDRAAELGIDLFVLDDGWEQTQGDWTPHKSRLPQGLEPIKEKLDAYGIKMGVWLSPMGIDSTTERYKQHPDWVIKDSEGNPILAQWGHPAFDFVGPFFDVFIEDCKRLIDEGALFFKWDAINTFYSSLPNHDHGSEAYSEAERRARYEYLLPVYVTRAMEILTDYEPELIIEMDVTEARRVMMGLAPMSQGKIFHMNNGVSWYNDYTAFRTNSMRTIPNEYNGIIPLELFTYANYPHNIENSMDYNVNTSLISGHGFWGDLSLTNDRERKIIGKKVVKSKLVLPYLTDIKTYTMGKVGDSLEIYTQINNDACAGQIIAFGNNSSSYTQGAKIDSTKLLAVLDHPYKFEMGFLTLNFAFEEEPSTKEAFIIPNEGIGISISSSTSVIDHAQWLNNQFVYKINSPGTQKVLWSKKHGKPIVSKSPGLDYTVEESGDYFKLTIKVQSDELKVVVRGTD